MVRLPTSEGRVCVGVIAASVLLLTSCAQEALDAEGDATAQERVAVIDQIQDTALREFIASLDAEARAGKPGANGRLAMAYDANGFDQAAEVMYLRAVAMDPEEFTWRYLLAVRLYKNGDLEGAIQEAQRASSLRTDYAALYVRLGSWQLDTGEPQLALGAFEQAKSLGAGPVAEIGIARAQLKLGADEEALSSLLELVERTRHPLAMRLLSDAWRAVGNETQARRFLTSQATESKPAWFDDPVHERVREFARGRGARLHEIELLLRSGTPDGVLQTLAELVAEAPDDFNVQYHFALSYFMTQSYELAESHLLKAIELEPIHYPSHLLLASLYQRRDENAQAAAQYQKVVAIYPNLQIAHQELGFVQLRLGDTEKALQSFNRAIELDSVAPNVHYYAGVILGDQGDCERALLHFDTTLTLDPAHERARVGQATCEQILANQSSP